MALPTAAEFKIRYPEFVDVLDVRVEFFIDEAALEVSAPRWATWFTKGVSALAAHLLKISLTINDEDNEDGSIDELAPVVSRAVGDVSITRGPYLSTDAGSDYWNLTPYGREYVRLRKLVGIGGVAVV